jgi:uncharacterized membrane protein YbhN (UPF0104 family)
MEHPWLQTIARWVVTLLILWLVFAVVLPRFIDYRDVIEAISTLRWGEVLLLLVLAVLSSLARSSVYTAVVPGLRFWPGWRAYEASGTLASFAPPGVDMAVRFSMYRTFGVTAVDAGAAFVLSGIFTIGIKLVLPVLALVLVVVSGRYERTTAITVVFAVAAAVIGGAVILLRREDLALGLGRRIGGWYNRLLAGRWRFEAISDPGEVLVAFRGKIVGTLGSVWHKALAGQVAAELVSFTLLLMALRFLGVTSADAGTGLVFVAYSVGLMAALAPLLPQGLGAVELVYVFMIAGTEESDLADMVMAAAFTHRIFTWFLPIVWGFIPLVAWRREVARAVAQSNDEHVPGEGSAPGSNRG